MPLYRKDERGIYKLFVERKFTKEGSPGGEFRRFFDARGNGGVAEIEQCVGRT